ncbi:hypothetical protein ACIGO9_14650 [Nocardia asteroides]|uniref:hypothetical protein n=1 Tax=Nocardia asteroides TaxID=1824 RepID=UPI0037C7220C
MHYPTDTDTFALMQKILDSLAIEKPADGACLQSAPRVTDALILQGIPAQTVTIAGWLDSADTILAFLHIATRCQGLVLDATARQFDQVLPAAWMTTEHNYLQALAIAAGVDHASIWETS